MSLLLALVGCNPGVVLIEDSDSGAVDSPPVDDTGDGPIGDPTLLCQLALTCPSGISDEPKRPCDLAVVSGDGVGVYDAMAMVEIRGRSSASFPKPPYAIELHEAAAWLVQPAATWQYLDGRATPAAGWQEPGFDGGWAQGVAPLGYGEDLGTTIDAGTTSEGVAPAAWFRADFHVADPSTVTLLELELVRDDGAIVWLNGHEVVRSNLGTGDWATSKVEDEFEPQWIDWDLDPALLVVGTNTLAVEVHQADAYSSDLRFDASLLASGGRVTPNLFGMGGEDDWVLGSAYVDRVLWRNKLAYDLFQGFGGAERWAAEQVFCELTLDGEYEGVYLLGESPRRDDDRLDVHADEGDGANFIVEGSEDGGFLENLATYGEWEAVYPDQREETSTSLPPIAAELTAWQGAVLGHDETQWDHADLDSAVDWVIVQELFKNSDAYYLSLYLWRDEGSRLRFTPWDLDLSLGYPYTDCGATGFVWRTELPTALSASPAFKERLVERWAELRADVLSDAAIRARIDAYETTLGPAIDRNFTRWPVDEIKFGWGDEDNWLCPAASWEEEHERVLGWLPDRTEWLDGHFGEY